LLGFWSASYWLGSLKLLAWVLERELFARLTQALRLDSGARAVCSAHSSVSLGFWSASYSLGSLKLLAWILWLEHFARLWERRGEERRGEKRRGEERRGEERRGEEEGSSSSLGSGVFP
jgi:hypothetical protein